MVDIARSSRSRSGQEGRSNLWLMRSDTRRPVQSGVGTGRSLESLRGLLERSRRLFSSARREGRSERLGRLCAAWMTILVVSGLSAAQAPPSGNASQARFRAQAYAVRIDVLVLDGGRPLRGLGRDDFRLTDNGVPQRVDVVSAESIAVDLVVAYDTSGSVRGDTLLAMRSALQNVIAQLRPQDRAALVPFSDSLDLRVGLTGDHALLMRQTATIGAGGRTRLRDGVFAAMALGADETSRTLVLVLTDGLDTGSWLDGETLAQLSDRTDATVYVVLMGPDDAAKTDRAVLTDIARRTGGRTVVTRSPDAVAKVFRQVLGEFNSRYVLSYTPRPPTAGWHGVQVSLSGTKRKTVLARHGYWLGQP